MLNNPFLHFTGSESFAMEPLITSIKDTFTYECWIKPTSAHKLCGESHQGMAGATGKNYCIGPSPSPSHQTAGTGIAVGTNGIIVFEHSINHFPAVLVHPMPISDWIHLAIVYNDKTPMLYVNGNPIKKGLTSIKQHIHPSGLFGGLPSHGFFSGFMRNIRIWDHARTQQQINASMNAALTGTEAGLYLYYNKQPEIITHKRKKRDIAVSILLPSYNKYPENTFTLRSLSNQVYDLSKVEVVLVDDGSQDATSTIINEADYPFLLKYIRRNTNGGRPHSRNSGLPFLSGNLIIFLDSEILVEPNFIEQHVRTHIDRPNTAVSAVMNQKGIYTMHYPDFSKEQKGQFEGILKSLPDGNTLLSKINDLPHKEPVISFRDIDNRTFQRLSFVKPHEPYYKRTILDHFGADFHNFNLSWLSFYTGNISVEREWLAKAGPFEDKRFEGYGWEDTDMGYRLYKLGMKFYHNEQILTYHQEHPVASTNQTDAKKNAYIFLMKFPDEIEAMTLALYVSGLNGNMVQLNQLINEYKMMEQQDPARFSNSRQALLRLLMTTGRKLADLTETRHLLRDSGLKSDRQLMRQLRLEARELKRNGHYPQFVETLEWLKRR